MKQPHPHDFEEKEDHEGQDGNIVIYASNGTTPLGVRRPLHQRPLRMGVFVCWRACAYGEVSCAFLLGRPIGQPPAAQMCVVSAGSTLWSRIFRRIAVPLLGICAAVLCQVRVLKAQHPEPSETIRAALPTPSASSAWQLDVSGIWFQSGAPLKGVGALPILLPSFSSRSVFPNRLGLSRHGSSAPALRSSTRSTRSTSWRVYRCTILTRFFRGVLLHTRVAGA